MMHAFRYERPARIRDIVELYSEFGDAARLLSGGTDLTVGLRDGKITPDAVIDVKQAEDFPPAIVESNGTISISATAVMTDIIEHDLVRSQFPALIEAASVVGSIQIRNRATLAGNICNASPAADTVPVLVVLGASVSILGLDGERSLPVVDFIRGNRDIALTNGELVISIEIPIPKQPVGAAFARMTRRRGVDLATINLCCSVDQNAVTTYAFGAVGPRPLLLQDTTGVLADTTATTEEKADVLNSLVSQATPISDIRATAEYRMAMLKVLARRSHDSATLRLRELGV